MSGQTPLRLPAAAGAAAAAALGEGTSDAAGAADGEAAGFTAADGEAAAEAAGAGDGLTAAALGLAAAVVGAVVGAVAGAGAAGEHALATSRPTESKGNSERDNRSEGCIAGTPVKNKSPRTWREGGGSFCRTMGFVPGANQELTEQAEAPEHDQAEQR